jgi:hypothetical protein
MHRWRRAPPGRPAGCARPRAAPTELALTAGLDEQLYSLVSQMDAAVSDQLTGDAPRRAACAT